MSKYPHIKAHLDKFQSIITSVNKPYGLHRARVESIFLGTRLYSLRKCARPTFTHVDFSCYVSRAFLIIKTDRIDSKYLTGLLNSRLVAFWLRHRGKLQGDLYQVDKEPLLSIPIRQPSSLEAKSVTDIVSSILAVTKGVESPIHGSMERQVREYKPQIDDLIYRLYGLSQKEIELIEQHVPV